MYTSAMLIALSATLAPAALRESPTWQSDYSHALQQGRENRKPLAVFVGDGSVGWERVSKEGSLNRDVNSLLAADYVCVYVDVSQSSGRQLADAFDFTEARGLVISDHTGRVQAFHHEGELSNETLAGYLRKFSDKDLVVRTTEDVADPQLRYYAPPSTPAYTQTFSGFGGFSRGC
jgi:hypothetical protein